MQTVKDVGVRVYERFDMLFMKEKEIGTVPVFGKQVFTVAAAIMEVELGFRKVRSSCILNARPFL